MFKKKITKLSLEELAKVMPVIEEWEMRTMVGGTGSLGSYQNPYPSGIFEDMLKKGMWVTGAYVDGLGYVLPELVVPGVYSGEFSHVGIPSNPMWEGVGVNVAYRVEGNHIVLNGYLTVNVFTMKVNRYYNASFRAQVTLLVNGKEVQSSIVSNAGSHIYSADNIFIGTTSFILPPSGLIQYRVNSIMECNDPTGNMNSGGSSLVTVRNY